MLGATGSSNYCVPWMYKTSCLLKNVTSYRFKRFKTKNDVSGWIKNNNVARVFTFYAY